MKVSGDQLFNPWKREQENLVLAQTPREVSRFATALVVEIFNKNKALGKSNPFSVCAILRNKPTIHRWFNVAMTIDAHNISPRHYGVHEYAGALSLAETLLDGSYYIASPEEEAVCAARDAKDREQALERNTQDKMGEANKFFAGIVQAAQMQITAKEQPTAVVGTDEKTRKKSA